MKRKKPGARKTPSHKSRREPTRHEAANKSAAKRRTGRALDRVTAGAGAEIAAKVREVADTRRLQESKTAAEAAIDAALDKRALLPVLIDVSDRATYTDFIAIVSGRSDRQVDAIAENIVETMSARGWRLLGREGSGNGRWTLLDFGDVVVHVFYHPVREFYDIESLWIDAPRVSLDVPPEARHFQEETLYYERP